MAYTCIFGRPRTSARSRSFTLEQIALATQRGRRSAARKQAGPNECPPPSPRPSPSLRPRLLITVVVVLRGSFSGIRQQRTGIADGRTRTADHCRRTDDAAAGSAIRAANKAAERRKATKAAGEGGAPTLLLPCATAAIGVRASASS